MGATKLNNKPSFFELVFCIGLVWVISTLLDDAFPDLNLLIHIALVISISSGIWSALSSKMTEMKRKAYIIKKYNKEIDEMVENNMSIMEIADRINALENARNGSDAEKKSSTQELQKMQIVIKNVGSVCGSYNNEPIYETIELDNGEIYEFDGVANKNVNINNLTKDSILFPNGFIYRPKTSN